MTIFPASISFNHTADRDQALRKLIARLHGSG